MNDNVTGAITLLLENLQKIVLEDDTVHELLVSYNIIIHVLATILSFLQEMMKGSIGALQCLTEGSYQKLLSLENHIRSCCHPQAEGEGGILSECNSNC